MTGPLIWATAYGLSVHAWWGWLALVQVQGVMDHSGYDLPAPLDVFKLLPGFGGTKFHDEFGGTNSEAPILHGQLRRRHLPHRRRDGHAG